jgi:hypothetical protein
MPRSSSSSGRGSSRSSFSNSSFKNSTVKPTTPREYTPSYQSSPINTNQTPVIHKIEQPGFLSNVMQGFAWGTGTSIARNMFESKPLQNTTPIVNKPNNQTNDCKTYELCKQMENPYECYSKMDQKEYALCKDI